MMNDTFRQGLSKHLNKEDLKVSMEEILHPPRINKK